MLGPFSSLMHLIAALFMAAPLYMLIMVNERARFAVPPGYNTDRYMENIIKGQPIRCYTYLAVVLITGLLLTGLDGWGWRALVGNMGVRVTFGYSLWLALVLLVVAALFAYRVFKTPLAYGWF